MALSDRGAMDSEDGTMLFGDADALIEWRGIESEATHSASILAALSQSLPGVGLTVSGKAVVIWDLHGAGTVDVYSDDRHNGILMVRSWLAESTSQNTLLDLASLPMDFSNAFAEFDVRSRFLVMFGPVESGGCIRIRSTIEYFLSEDDMMTESSGLIFTVANGCYRCFHDTVKNEQGEARRCYVVPNVA